MCRRLGKGIAQPIDQLEQRQVRVAQLVAHEVQVACGIALQHALEPVEELGNALLPKGQRAGEGGFTLVLQKKKRADEAYPEGFHCGFIVDDVAPARPARRLVQERVLVEIGVRRQSVGR